MSGSTVFFIGNVATQITAERFTRQDGELLDKARCLVAVSRLTRRGTDGEEPDPDYIPVEAWGALARALAQFNQKGSKVGITGRLRSEFYKPEGAEKGSLRTAVVAERIEFLTPRRLEVVPDNDRDATDAQTDAPRRPAATAARERRS
jgi:single-stranded DNA-binding protein